MPTTNPNPERNAMSRDEAEALAVEIATDLFTAAFEPRLADRLVLVHEERSGDMKRNLGGWYFGAVRDRIADKLCPDKPKPKKGKR